MIMVLQMKELGHDAKWVPDNKHWLGAGNGINVVVEGFRAPHIAELADARANGARFVILATEEPTDKGFNHGTQREMVERQATFPEAAKHCEGILHLVPGEHVTRWYSQHAPSAYADLGYARSLVRRDAVVPDYEFGFYGSLTPRRLKILKRLAKMTNADKAVRIVSDFQTQDERDRTMQRAKVILQLRKFDAMGLVSSSRCATALSIGRPVVAEPHDLCRPWDDVVSFAKTMDGFYSLAMTARSAWRGIHAAQFEKFKERMSPQRCVGDALEAIGIPSPRRMAA
jgi:hypothetical protein